ncbi:lipid A export permease/ATP-binding protein MsbA [Thermomonas haemolytica]|uniref:Subfamily B ATP-binding cassette protein MsbA n=1 Tax=Thermomonas haemolytica TaxID=141949 RepID=A0A4R3N2I6_9GAMM|nr:lipid A export permease/ATP-binding protein MsbA [Thermomonas haemolytica]TCT22487.1 subfamily B ATP-binding cassette protein MsbA [Thermomonas haemolytica]TNY29262.1 lipid A export permease/ATP-binding protein MsbA [Thermomonas haemolytica]
MSLPPSAWAIYRRLLGLVGPYRGVLLLALLGLVVEGAAAGAFGVLTKPMVDETFVARNREFGLLLPLAIVGIFAVRGMAGYLTDLYMAKAARGVARDMRVRAMDKYLRLPGLRFDGEPVPSMLVRLGSDSDQVAQAVVDAGKVMLQQSLQVVAMLAVMLYASWRVTLAVLLLGPLIAWMMDKVGRRYRRYGHKVQETSAQMMLAADQALSNQQEVKVYGAREMEMARYTKLANDNLRLSLKVEATRSISSALVQLTGAVGLALLLYFAGREALAGRLTAGGFVQLMISMLAIIPALKQLTNVQGMLQRGVASAERLFHVLDAEDEVDTGTRPLQRAQGLIEFRDVSLRYPGQTQPALERISFIARPGTVTAIVGRSGSGKSSLVKLIPRFYDPDGGQILLDGHPISEYRLVDLRRQLAMVGQQVMLFDGSVVENVAYGELQQTTSEDVQRALSGANAMEFVAHMPHGADTHIGVKGGKLSGGQRQRLAIARAMLKDAPILILDEATAALDNASERLVQEALAHLIPDRTTLVIAHRLSTVEHADQILVLDEGRLVEQGTHAELLARGGVYAHLHAMQFREAGA